MYSPDKWRIIKGQFQGEDDYRVFGTWGGGYLTGDSWRVNSGIMTVEDDGDYWNFHGFTQSVYRCRKEAHGIAGAYNNGVLQNLLDNNNYELIEEADVLAVIELINKHAEDSDKEEVADD